MIRFIDIRYLLDCAVLLITDHLFGQVLNEVRVMDHNSSFEVSVLSVIDNNCCSIGICNYCSVFCS